MTPRDAGVTLGSELLDRLQRVTFDYFLNEVNPANGLVADKTRPDYPASIAATGLALAAYPVGVERGLVTRERAVERTLSTLGFLSTAPEGPEPNAAAHKGFFYHWLDRASGRRAWRCELSTVDTGFLVAGALAAAVYFDGEEEGEREIRALADSIYRRIDWRWALDGGPTLTHGWKPESGFLPHRWEGYNEALLLYTLALGSPTYPIPPECYEAWLATYAWKSIYDIELIYAGPLFIHQLSHVWIDFRGIQDRYVRERGIDYFENSRRATYVQQEYAVRNPNEFAGYGKHCWGITASDGPGPGVEMVDGVERRFYDYIARGVPYGPDDGTIAPWAVVASLPFAPEIVVPTVEYFREIELHPTDPYGFEATFNPTYPHPSGRAVGWFSPYHYGLNQGPIVLMIENYRTGLLWRLMRRCKYVVEGLGRAGFRGGWLA
jgi:hypothetical protein